MIETVNPGSLYHVTDSGYIDEGPLHNFVPGDKVRNIHDDRSYGTVVGTFVEGSNNLWQIVVVWSRSPFADVVGVQVQTITTRSRKLKAMWSVERMEDLSALYAINASTEVSAK